MTVIQGETFYSLNEQVQQYAAKIGLEIPVQDLPITTKEGREQARKVIMFADHFKNLLGGDNNISRRIGLRKSRIGHLRNRL